MKKLTLFGLIFLASITLVSAMSKSPGEDILVPAENYIIDLTDIDGVVTRGSNVSFEKNLYLSAMRGSTAIFIPFDRIKTIEMLNNHEVITNELPDVDMTITLNDGSTYASKGASHQEITGEAGFGKFRIRLDHIQRIEFIQLDSQDNVEEQEATEEVE